MKMQALKYAAEDAREFLGLVDQVIDKGGDEVPADMERRIRRSSLNLTESLVEARGVNRKKNPAEVESATSNGS